MASATLDASIFWPASMAITPRSRRRSPQPYVCNCKEQTEADASWSFENSAADQSEDLYARDSSSHHCCWTPGVDGRDSSAVPVRRRKVRPSLDGPTDQDRATDHKANPATHERQHCGGALRLGGGFGCAGHAVLALQAGRSPRDRTACLWMQPGSNRSPPQNSLLAGKRTGNFAESGPPEPTFAPSRPANSVACRKIPYAMEQGIF
jgi:hypothetical protein